MVLSHLFLGRPFPLSFTRIFFARSPASTAATGRTDARDQGERVVPRDGRVQDHRAASEAERASGRLGVAGCSARSTNRCGTGPDRRWVFLLHIGGRVLIGEG